MDIKDNTVKQIKRSEMIEDKDYFRYVYKKSERITITINYLLKTEDLHPSNDKIVLNIEQRLEDIMDVCLESLSVSRGSVLQYVSQLRTLYVGLESYLRIAEAVQYIEQEHLDVFVQEISNMLRTLKVYIDDSRGPSLGGTDPALFQGVERKERKVAISKVSGKKEDSMGPLQGQSRRDKVLSVIRDKGSATIKDISDQIKDCSEKTIQRELIVLIKDNIIKREGERRWSKYSLLSL